MSPSDRSRELAADLARRAIEAAEQRRAEAGPPDPDELAARLRGAAGADGRLSVDEAVRAVTGSESDGPVNWLGEYAQQKREAHEGLPRPEPEPAEPPSRPEGTVNAGEGEGDPGTYESTPHGLMRTWDLNELWNKDKETKE